uniref:Non-specific serine/threonine protein kinase n=1 Tax=Schistosoma mansoni TaxID=6183 RepID=A0A3Q0KQT2_SCHMA
MACSLSLKKCLAVCGNHDEELLLSTLSCVKAQLQHGFKYYSQVGNLDTMSKEHVRRLVKRMSGFLDLSEPLSHEILVHFLAVEDIADDRIDEVLAGWSTNCLLEDIRRYYWKDRLCLIRLLKLCVCQWHDSWSLISDVLFAMTSYESRRDLVVDALNEYLVQYQNTCSLIESWGHSSSGFVSNRNTVGADESSQFGVVAAQKLKELVELLELILLGVHGLSLTGTIKNSPVVFKKVLETFWSISFGSSLKSLRTNNLLVDQICFTQTLILIRAANLDSIVLFSNQSLDDFALPYRRSKISNVASKSKLASENTISSKDEVPTHFLYDSNLLNRLLASLSNLGEYQVHGPLLLFGAVCATAFTHSGSVSRNSSDPSPDSTYDLSGYAKSQNFDENISVISDHCAQLSIQNLDVFRFLVGRLDRTDFRPPQVSQMDCNVSVPYSEFNASLVSLATHSAVFDLVTLLARDVALWSLDSNPPPTSQLFDSLDYPNRDGFLTLFSRTLQVVVTNAHLVRCPMSKGIPDTSDDVPDFPVDSGPRIGCRIFGLIESLIESFPYDLSVLRIYTSLLVPSNSTKIKSGSINLVNHVKEFINHVPYLAEPLTEALSKHLSSRNASLYPQLTSTIEKKLHMQVVLNKPRTVMTVNSKITSASASLPERNNIFSGVYLASGTQGYVDQDLGLVVWRIEYSLWHVIGNEIYLAELALNDFHKSIASSMDKYEARVLLNATSYDSESLQIQAEFYAQFYTRLTRLLDLLEFISACLKCDLYISQCLISIEYIWMIILRYLNIIPSDQVNLIVQHFTNNISSSSFIKIHRNFYGKIKSSNEIGINRNSIDELIIHLLLPNLLCLIGQSLLNLPTLKSKQLIMENINLLTSVLNNSHSIIPRMVINQNGQSSQLTFGLNACYLINTILNYNSSEPINFLNFQQSTSFHYHYHSTNVYHLLISYINFISGLFYFIRWVYSNSEFIIETIHIDIIPLYIECSELIHGCLVFIIQHLMIMFSQVDYYAENFSMNSINNGLIQKNHLLKVDFDQLANLAEHCFMLLTDVLTTRTSEQDVQILRMILKQLKQESSSSSTSLFHLFPKFISEENHWPITYQCITLHLLLNDTRSLNALIAFSSIHQSILLRQTETIEYGFPMSVYFNNRDISRKTILVDNSSSPTVRAVWLSLTLVHHLLNLENKLLIEPGNSNPITPPLLTSIQCYSNSFTGDHYITTLFFYLRYSFSVGISRLVVALLKWITQYSSVDITNYLGSESNQVRASCLKKLVSTTEDQLVRVGLYDLLSETVLNSEKYGPISSRLPVGLLRLLLTDGTVIGSDMKLNRMVATKSKEISNSDCLDCVIDTLKELQNKSFQKQFDDNDTTYNNQLSTVLFWSVTKFISSLYLLNIQPCIVNLKQRCDFWKTLTDPFFTLLRLQESEKEPLSDIENELCGDVVSILALELYNKTSYTTNDESFKSFTSVMDYFVKNNLYNLWFKLTRKCLHKVLSSSESEDISIEYLQSRLTSLHNVTCRWKCLLLLNYNDDNVDDDNLDAFLTSDSNSNRNQLMNSRKQSKDDFIAIPLSILSDLIECFSLLCDLPPIQSTFDLGNQLATILNTTLVYLYKTYNTSKKNTLIGELSTNDLANYLTKLNDLLSSFRLAIDFQVQHMHSDLLASTYILFSWYNSKRLNEKTTDDQFELLQSSLFNNAVCFLSLLTRNPNINRIEESAILQSINLITFLWDHNQSTMLFTRLTDAGVLNNIFILLTECTKLKDGATLSHSLISLLVKLVINSSQPTTLTNTSIVNTLPHPTRTDLDESTDQCINESENNLLHKPKNIITHLILSYHEYISQAFCWPQLETLRQWLQDGESYSNIQVNSFDDNCYMKQTQSVHYDWNAVLILEMQFLCLLHDNVGGMKHPLAYSLIQNFCMDNASQLEFLVNYWCSSLYNNNTSINDQHLMSPLPITSVLIQQGLLSTGRIQLAETILKLYWRILVAAEYIGTSGLPIIASNILHSNHSRIANLTSRIPWPSYGPTVHSEFFNTVFNLIQCQIHCCSILFQRHGFKSFKSVPISGSHITPTKSGIANQSISSPSGTLTSTLPKTTLLNEVVTSSHPVTSVTMESSGSETSGLEFLYLIRHLIMSLSVLMVQLPILGKASLMTSDELKYLKVHVHLTFNSPNLNDNSTVLTFGVLITLANSLGSLSSKLSSVWKSCQSSESVVAQKKRELCCLVQRAYEMVLSIIFSQSTILLTSPSIRLMDKQLLLRELTAELKACHSFGISLRRTSSVGHPTTNTSLPRSPSSRSSSTHLRLSSASPQTTASSSSHLRNAPPPLGSTIPLMDSSSFGFDKAANRFIELSRLNL